jgi:hypothetical protein
MPLSMSSKGTCSGCRRSQSGVQRRIQLVKPNKSWCLPSALRPIPNDNYRPSPRLRWKLQSTPPRGVNVPDTC